MMNINNNKHKLRVTILTTCIIALFSCSKESILDGRTPGEPATIAVNTRAANDPGDMDEKVVSLRVMTFAGSGDGDRIEFNTLRTGLTTDMTTFDLRTGTRTVVFISNETTTMATALAGVTKLGDLKNITVEWSAFNATAAIPAYARYDAVTISKTGDAAIISGAGTDFTGGKWKIALERLAVKIKTLTLTSERDITTPFSGITFSNLPSNVPLVPSVKYNTSGAAQTGTMLPAADFTITFTGGVWKAVQKSTTRIILPSKEFTPTTEEDHAVIMTANMSSGASPSGCILHTTNPPDYTLHRNTEYTLSATTLPMRVNVVAKQWTSQDIPSTLGRELNVSDCDVTLGSANMYMIYFSSNQPEAAVTVDPTAIKIYQGNQTTEATTVAMELFTEAAGNYSYTYNSTTGQGNGWIKIIAKPTFETSSIRKINLNAGGLKRQITVKRN